MADDIAPLASTPGRVIASGAKVSPGGDQGATGAAGPPGGLGEAPIDGQTYGRKSSAWAAIPGGGNVSNTGTPAAGQVALWTNATTIQGSASWLGGWISGSATVGGNAAGNLSFAYSAPFINIQPQGTDPDVYVQLTSKGTGGIDFYTAAFTRNQLMVENAVSGGVYLGVHGGAGLLDNIHLSDNSPIAIFNANLTGAPNAVTPTAGDSSTKVATTAFVAAVAAAMFTTGDAKLTLKAVADAGWIMMNDGTIGDATSGATTRANADCQALFILLWTNIPDQGCPVTPGGRGASAAADWAAHKKLQLSRQLGRALAISGAGAGLTNRGLGGYLGEETHTLTVGEIPSHTHAGSTSFYYPYNWSNMTITWEAGGTYVGLVTDANTIATTTGVNISAAGGGGAHNVMQPTSFWNVMLKL